MVWLCMTTGLRRGELAGLRWSDISFEALTINVVRSVVDQARKSEDGGFPKAGSS